MGRPRNVHGDQNRNFGQDLYARLHVYPTIAAANADLGTAEARLIYIAATQSAWFGRPGAWVEVAAGSAPSGAYPAPGALPVGTLNPLGNVVSINTATGDITFSPGALVGQGIAVGDWIVVTGSLDAAPAAFLDSSYQVLAYDELTSVVNVGVGALPSPTLPVSSYGSGQALVNAPVNGQLAVVNRDPVTGGVAVWAFTPYGTPRWVRIIDADPRVIFRSGVRPFTGIPSVDSGAGAPTAPRDVTTKDYVDAGDAAALAAANAFATGEVAAHTTAFNHADFLVLQTFLDALGTNHNIPTVVAAGVAIAGITAASHRVTLTGPPTGMRVGDSITITGTVSNNHVATIYALGANYVELLPGLITTDEGAGGTLSVTRGFDHNLVGSGAGAALAAHAADPGDPHNAAGYQKQAQVDARIAALAASPASVNAAVSAGVANHDAAPGAHGGLAQRVDALLDAVEAASPVVSLVPVQLGAVAAANGIPLTSVDGVWKPVANVADVVLGVLEAYSATVALGSCDASGSAVTNTVTVSNGLAGAQFVPGNAYVFAGLSAAALTVEHVDGNVLYMVQPVPTANVVAAAVTEYPRSRVVLNGALRISKAATRVTGAAISTIARTDLEIGAAFAIQASPATPLGSARVGDTITVTGHTASPGKNGSWTVQSVDPANNAVLVAGVAGDAIPAQSAAITAATKTIMFAAFVSMARVSAGQTVTITGSGAGNNGTYTVAAFDKYTKTITVAEPFAANEAVVTAKVSGTNLLPYVGSDYTAKVVLGVALENILQIDTGTGVVRVAKGSVPSAAIGRTLSLRLVTSGASSDGDYAITAVNTAPADYDEITIPSINPALSRPAGLWGAAGVDGWDANNLASIDVTGGGSNGTFTFKNAVLGGVQPGDRLVVSGTPIMIPGPGAQNSDGEYIVMAVVSPTVLRVYGVIPGSNNPGPSAGSAFATRPGGTDGTMTIAYAGGATAFGATTPAAPTQYYVDTTNATKCSTTPSASKVGFQVDAYTFIVRIP